VSPFEELHPALRYHVVNTLRWSDLRPTQLEAIRPVQAGDDVLLLAPTAGGKTEAALLPLLSRMAIGGWQGLSALYLCPLRALLNNLAPRVERYATMMGRRAALWHGDVGAAPRHRILRELPDLLLTTPESLEAVLISPRVDHHGLLSDVRTVIVDELHAFAGDDRGWHLLALLERVERLVGRRPQRIGLSATIGNADELLAWLTRGRGGHVVGPTKPPADGDVTADHVGSLQNAVTVLSRVYRGERRLVFADSRARVEELTDGLRRAGIRTFVSHGSLAADERRQAEAAFASEPDCVIVATSTLELGIDVGDLDRVVQIDAPPSVAAFLQRMGRSGRRAGAKRNCLVLATGDDDLLTALGITALWRSGFVDPVVPPPRPAHIYAQQVIALVLQEGGLARGDADRWVGDALAEVPATDRTAVVAHMLARGVLTEDQGILGVGPMGEREFGRRHFIDVVAAFSSPMLLAVRHGRAELGSVHPASLARRDDAPTLILLGGRSWRVVGLDWARRTVDVVPAEAAGRSRWLGSGRPLSASIGRAIERVAVGDAPGCTLSRRASARLAEIRERLDFVDGSSMPVVRDATGHSTVWTFAGDRANAMLAGALRAGGMSVVSANGLALVVRNADGSAVAAAIDRVDPTSAPPEVPPGLAAELKFSECLPPQIAAAVVEGRLCDRAALDEALRRPRRVITVAS
jgi:ATP-dependent Lhr-like helicase